MAPFRWRRSDPAASTRTRFLNAAVHAPARRIAIRYRQPEAMPADPTSALYVRLPHREFDKLDRAAIALATNKKALVTTLVSHYVDPDSPQGLDHLRTIAGARPPQRVTVDLQQDELAVGHHAFTPAPAPDVLTPKQAAELLQVTEDEVVELAEQGKLPGRRIGDRWRFSRPALIAWLAGA
jgi:excisionase family DNA binding protein